MNATQFIQQHGVDKARAVVELAPQGATHLSDDTRHYVNADFKPLPNHIKEQLPKLIVIDDLKRLVESVDLVNCNGGWNGTKNTITLFQYSLDLGLYHGVDGVDAEVEIPRLKQAIADYEAIYSIPQSVKRAILNLEMHL